MITLLEDDPRLTIIHHSDQRGDWATSGRRILFKARNSSIWELLGQFPFVMKREIFGWNRITQRLARADKCLLFPSSDGTLIGIRSGNIYRFEDGKAHCIMESLQGDCPLHRSMCEPEAGILYFGEYFMNPKRQEVRIIRIMDQGTRWEIAYSFKPGEIRHVHGIYLDPFLIGRMWVTTGDLQGENYIFHTDDHFNTLIRHGDGSQRYRAVGLHFSESSVMWATDSPLEQNYSVCMDRKTNQTITHQPFPSSCWYSTTTTDGLFLTSSAVEKGPAVNTNFGTVWASENGYNWEKMVSFRKDKLPMPLFKWGTISFPSGSYPSSRVWISGEALSGLDGRSKKYSFR
ncbi:hypothetical protein OAH23_14480 [Verrucomicrobia bacterium]|nr:hypothetical protein [Verrucomicrobiota bacterium]